MLKILHCLDSDEIAEARRRELDIPRSLAIDLGKTALLAIQRGYYVSKSGRVVNWRTEIEAAIAAKVSIPPDRELPQRKSVRFSETTLQVSNETTLQAARRMVNSGLQPLALNFADGTQPGGGFLNGARAQEEVLCRSSALYQTLVGDRMYIEHRRRPEPDATDWAILSPQVPVFRTDDGTALESPWLLSFISCAAPFAPKIGQPRSADLLRHRIHRILAIARAYGYTALVLGAWGCGAYGNDPYRTALDFRQALENEFAAAFSVIIFAITDWSPERKFLKPFKEVFS